MPMIDTPRPRYKGQMNGPYLPVAAYMSMPGHVATSVWTANVNILCAHPMPIPRDCVLDRVLINQGALADAGLVRMGIYRDTGAGKPGALVSSVGTVNLSTVGASALTITIALTLAAGDYWIAGVTQGHTSGPSLTTWANDLAGIGVTGVPSSGVHNGYTVNSISGALPDPFGAVATSSVCPRMWWRASS